MPDPVSTAEALLLARAIEHSELWTQILADQNRGLVEQVAATQTPTPSFLDRLRNEYAANLIAVAIELVKARRAASAKLESAANLLADVEGVAQATPTDVARYKARRLSEAGGDELLDLCCGIGGDATEFKSAGLSITGIDLISSRCIMASHNAGIRTVCDDATEIDLTGRWVHCDPARRDERIGARHHRLIDYQPGAEFLHLLLDRAEAAAIKLGPGIHADELPRSTPFELEFISWRGVLNQAAIWSNHLAPEGAVLRATMIPAGLTLSGQAAAAPIWRGDAAPQWLFEADPALERAQLLHRVCESEDVCELHAGLGILAGMNNPKSPWLRAFEIVADMPWRESKIRRWLRDHGGGIVEVKTRGKAVDPTPLQRTLRGKGDQPYSVLIYRLGTRIHAYICRRPADGC